MSIFHTPTVRNAIATERKAELETGGDALCKIYTAGKTTLIATLNLGPNVGTVTNETLVFSAFPQAVAIVADDVVMAEAYLENSLGEEKLFGDVTESGGGGFLQLSSANPLSLRVFSGQNIEIASGSYTASP